jgi:hypothetical protein
MGKSEVPCFLAAERCGDNVAVGKLNRASFAKALLDRKAWSQLGHDETF